MFSTSDLRKGKKVKLEGGLYTVIDFQHARTAQRRANVWMKLKNLKTGAVLEKTVSAGETFDEPDFEEKTLQYLYNDGENYFFMDGKSFEQLQILAETLEDTRRYLVENSEYRVLFFEQNPISLDLPTSITLKVISCEPAVKGDTVTNITKASVLESGLEVKVPLFIKEGDMIKVDTRTGDYLERVSQR